MNDKDMVNKVREACSSDHWLSVVEDCDPWHAERGYYAHVFCYGKDRPIIKAYRSGRVILRDQGFRWLAERIVGLFDCGHIQDSDLYSQPCYR